eukprot:6114451-Pleurochrysis_carterae.AAC.1
MLCARDSTQVRSGARARAHRRGRTQAHAPHARTLAPKRAYTYAHARTRARARPATILSPPEQMRNGQISGERQRQHRDGWLKQLTPRAQNAGMHLHARTLTRQPTHVNRTASNDGVKANACMGGCRCRCRCRCRCKGCSRGSSSGKASDKGVCSFVKSARASASRLRLLLHHLLADLLGAVAARKLTEHDETAIRADVEASARTLA